MQISYRESLSECKCIHLTNAEASTCAPKQASVSSVMEFNISFYFSSQSSIFSLWLHISENALPSSFAHIQVHLKPRQTIIYMLNLPTSVPPASYLDDSSDTRELVAGASEGPGSTVNQCCSPPQPGMGSLPKESSNSLSHSLFQLVLQSYHIKDVFGQYKFSFYQSN